MKDYKKKIRQASNAYLKYLDHIRELESMANDIIKDSPLYEYIDGPITCERFPDSGLSFIIEVNYTPINKGVSWSESTI